MGKRTRKIDEKATGGHGQGTARTHDLPKPT